MSIVVLIIWLFVLPVLAGGLLEGYMNKQKRSLPFAWVMGQILLWAVFQLICVPCILAEKEFTEVVKIYQGSAALLSIAAICVGLWQRIRGRKYDLTVQKEQVSYSRWASFLWILFFVLLAFQLFQAMRLTYSDGDDAYYVAVASIAEECDLMYMKLPYTGGTTGLDARHSLAPFPIWIAFLSRISGVPVVSTAHIVIPLFSILMAYAVYYLAGAELFGRKGEKLPLFMVFTEILVLFGDYSVYTPEKFLIARSRQGKAALSGIVIPLLFYLILLILRHVSQNIKTGWTLWLLLSMTITAACLCTTQGAELSCLLVAAAGLCAAVCYRRWKILIPMAVCCIPAVCYALLYFVI